MKIAISRVIVGGALVGYMANLALPAFECRADQPFFRFPGEYDPVGYLVFLFGWLGIIVGEFRWFANVPFSAMVVQLLAMTSSTKRLIYPMLVVPVALSCILIPAKGVCGHNYLPSKSLAVGGYIWVFVVVLVSTIYTFEWIAQSKRLRGDTNAKKGA